MFCALQRRLVVFEEGMPGFGLMDVFYANYLDWEMPGLMNLMKGLM